MPPSIYSKLCSGITWTDLDQQQLPSTEDAEVGLCNPAHHFRRTMCDRNIEVLSVMHDACNSSVYLQQLRFGSLANSQRAIRPHTANFGPAHDR